MIGTTIHDRYLIVAEIGKGGMGTVYCAHDSLLKRDVAIKLISKSELGSQGRARLLEEAQLVAGLKHPNIVTIYDVGDIEETPFIVMEMVAGQSLREKAPNDLEEIVRIAIRVCTALGHAHEQGVIHRDLKPENVMIAADGSVKLMDFGLARSIASRMSTEGIIVGTVFYLAPEQAMGQTFDGRADLYSLGVMLYELTTGELPFMADDPVAVISQHLYAPVVPPRAKNEQIPPALEALILCLLSKDPDERPASAEEVCKLLEEPEMLDREALPAEELSVLERIVRGRMVGRDVELKQAHQAWQQAIGGGGQLLLISGEPGIGKTRLMREISTVAEVSGGQVLVGECQAEGNAPYAPFAQLTRRALRANGYEFPKPVLADILALSPELQVDYPDVQPNPKLDPEAEQRRLFENMVRFCDILCQEAPLLMILEDIHWADSGSLHMLEHLARRTRQLPVMLLGTYREVELDEALPFHETLLGLIRRRLGQRVKLERLDREKTRDLLGVIFAEEITPEFLEGIYKETEGNPFFIEEVCKALVETGQVWYEGGSWQRAPDMADVIIPQGIKIAIQSRVNKLSQETQGILLTAAVIGREFDYETLHKVTQKSEEVLIDSLEEAIGKQLIEEMKGAGGELFTFTHALIPATLRESISGLRRMRLHRRVAIANEELRAEDYEHLAYHWGEAGDEQKGLAYTIKAAERAQDSYSNEDAVRLYTEAITIIPDDDPQRFDLLAGRSAVFYVIGEWKAQLEDIEAMLSLAEKEGNKPRKVDALLNLAELYLETEASKARYPAEQALKMAKEIGDVRREGRALYCLGMLSFEMMNLEIACKQLEESAACLKRVELKGETAKVLSMLSLMFGYLGDASSALKTAKEAVELSREVGDKLLEGTALRRLAITYDSNYQTAEALPFAEAALELHREVGDISGEISVLLFLGNINQDLKMLKEAEAHYQEGLSIAESINQTSGITRLVSNLGHFYEWNLGEYETSMDLVQRQLDIALICENKSLIIQLRDIKAYIYYLLGKFNEALHLDEVILPEFEELLDFGLQTSLLSFMAILCMELGKFDLAHQYMQDAMERCLGIKGQYIESWVMSNCALAAAIEGEESTLKVSLEWIRGVVDYARQHNMIMELGRALWIEACIHMALSEDDPTHVAEALKCTEGTMKAFETRHWWVMPERTLFQHSRALRVNKREEEADDYLRLAYERVMLVAGNFTNEDYRRSYLENVRHNREILAAYQERFGE